MDYVPVAQPIIGWISLTIMSISRLCLCHVDIQKMKEADKLYLLWGFLCAVFQGTRISPIGYMSPNRWFISSDSTLGSLDKAAGGASCAPPVRTKVERITVVKQKSTFFFIIARWVDYSSSLLLLSYLFIPLIFTLSLIKVSLRCFLILHYTKSTRA